MRFAAAAPDVEATARRWADPSDEAASRWWPSRAPVAGSSARRATTASTPRVPSSRSPSPTTIRAEGWGPACWVVSPRSPTRPASPRFEAIVLPENGPMLEVFRESGLRRASSAVGRASSASRSRPRGAEARDRFERREALAAAAAVRALPRPCRHRRRRGVARAADDRRRPLPQPHRRRVHRTGVSRQPGRHGGPGRPGVPDDPRHPGSGRPGHRRVPAAAVATVARQCAQKGVKGLVVISAGFSEVGGEDLDCRPSCSTSVARPACGSSARIAWASPTPTRPSR